MDGPYAVTPRPQFPSICSKDCLSIKCSKDTDLGNATQSQREIQIAPELAKALRNPSVNKSI